MLILCKNLYNFVPPTWKLLNRYCHKDSDLVPFLGDLKNFLRLSHLYWRTNSLFQTLESIELLQESCLEISFTNERFQYFQISWFHKKANYDLQFVNSWNCEVVTHLPCLYSSEYFFQAFESFFFSNVQNSK